MTNLRYSYEKSINIWIIIWNDNTGDRLYVGPDGDGLDLVELRDISLNGNINHRFTLTKEQALLVSKAINELYGEKDD
jgi:hypothetical protein